MYQEVSQEGLWLGAREERGSEERTEGEGGVLSQVEEQTGPVSEQVNTKGEAK